MQHDFWRSKEAGDRWETWFTEWAPREFPGFHYKPVESGGKVDRSGVDGHLYARCQVKGDERAHETGNIFVETHSVREANVLGWAQRGDAADWLFYLVPGLGLVFQIRLSTLAGYVPDWSARFRFADSPNRRTDGTTYTTRGLLVPIAEFAEAAERMAFSAELYRRFVETRAAA